MGISERTLYRKLTALDLLDEAALLAAGYDYDTAIAKLEGFTGNKAKYPEMEIRLSEYKQQSPCWLPTTIPVPSPIWLSMC